MTNQQFAFLLYIAASIMLLCSGMFFYRAWQERVHPQAGKPASPITWLLMAIGCVLAAVEICLAGNSIYVPQAQRPIRAVFVLLMGVVAFCSAAVIKLLHTSRQSRRLLESKSEIF